MIYKHRGLIVFINCAIYTGPEYSQTAADRVRPRCTAACSLAVELYDPPRQRRSASGTSADGAFPLEAPLATQISCRPSDDSQRSSQAMQQDRVPQCSRLAPHCLHDTCTSYECERTASSSLRRLHMFTRASMAQDRLSSLALIHIHYDMEIDLDEVVQIFSVKEPRRMQLTNVLRD